MSSRGKSRGQRVDGLPVGEVAAVAREAPSERGDLARDVEPSSSSEALTPTMSAPAAASATAAAFPIPRRHPVTSAVLPASTPAHPAQSTRIFIAALPLRELVEHRRADVRAARRR